ncbi:hypothetical protein ACM66B_001220 [Microbotryomycetes sp. NB124-2]
MSLKYLTNIWKHHQSIKPNKQAQRWFTETFKTGRLFELLAGRTGWFNIIKGTTKPNGAGLEFYLSSQSCILLNRQLGYVVGDAVAETTFKLEACVRLSTLQQKQVLTIQTAEQFQRALDDLDIATERAITLPLANNLATIRDVWTTLRKRGTGSAIAIDVEWWEHNHDRVTEVGWSLVDMNGFNEGRGDCRLVIEENQKCRNKQYVSDARDLFAFGRSEVLPIDVVCMRLVDTIYKLSRGGPVFVLFYGAAQDLQKLELLGVDPNMFKTYNYHTPDVSSGVHVVDVQSLYRGFIRRRQSKSLGDACKNVGITTVALHNAANDAHFTLDLFELMMHFGTFDKVKKMRVVDLPGPAIDKVRPEDLLW